MKLAENLQGFRKEKRLSQEYLVEMCQVSRQAIAKWESGESISTIDKLVYLADLYEVTLDELVGRTTYDKYSRVKEYFNEFAAKDIPKDVEDDISAIVTRYLLFVERMELSASDKLKGLEEIFLTGTK